MLDGQIAKFFVTISLMVAAVGLYAIVSGNNEASVTAADRGHTMATERRLKTAYPDGLYYDARFGTKCPNEICFVPFSRIIAFPERYDEKTIMTVGFLKRRLDGEVALFPTEDSAKSSGMFEYIYIENARKPDSPALLISADLEPKLKSGVWVHVTGRFDAVTADQFSLGTLHDGQGIEEVDYEGPPSSIASPTPIFKGVKPPAISVPPVDIQPDPH